MLLAALLLAYSRAEDPGAFLVEGPCRVEGNCVLSPHHPDAYGNNEYCRIVLTEPAHLTAPEFDVEAMWSDGRTAYGDELTVNGAPYDGTTGPDVRAGRGTVLEWRSDKFGTRGGWTVCAAPASASSVGGVGTSFAVVSGDCTYDPAVDCVRSPNYPGSYGTDPACENSDPAWSPECSPACEIRVEADTSVQVAHFDTERTRIEVRRRRTTPADDPAPWRRRSTHIPWYEPDSPVTQEEYYYYYEVQDRRRRQALTFHHDYLELCPGASYDPGHRSCRAGVHWSGSFGVDGPDGGVSAGLQGLPLATGDVFRWFRDAHEDARTGWSLCGAAAAPPPSPPSVRLGGLESDGSVRLQGTVAEASGALKHVTAFFLEKEVSLNAAGARGTLVTVSVEQPPALAGRSSAPADKPSGALSRAGAATSRFLVWCPGGTGAVCPGEHRYLPLLGVRICQGPRSDAAATVAELRRTLAPDCLVEEDVAVHAATDEERPNDPDYDSLWGMEKISAPEAWAIHRGDAGVLVGVIDSGVDYTHPDLQANMWVNEGETGLDEDGNDRRTNGVDDDGNGYVDDVHGYDFVDNDGDPMDESAVSHGTHCAGTVGARGNNGEGVAGVAWAPKIMALRCLGRGGTLAGCAQALEYAIAHGATITSNSWGASYQLAIMDAMLREVSRRDHLFVVAAGNSGTDNDRKPTYPCSSDVHSSPHPAVICVAASRSTDTLIYNYGATSVHVAAPGANILSTVRRDYAASGYARLSGTSMATPHVAGLAALLQSAGPLGGAATKQLIMGTADQVPGFQGKVISNGRINAAAALRAVPGLVLVEPRQLVIPADGSGTVTLRVRRDAARSDVLLLKVAAAASSWAAPVEVARATLRVDLVEEECSSYLEGRTDLKPLGQWCGAYSSSAEVCERHYRTGNAVQDYHPCRFDTARGRCVALAAVTCCSQFCAARSVVANDGNAGGGPWCGSAGRNDGDRGMCEAARWVGGNRLSYPCVWEAGKTNNQGRPIPCRLGLSEPTCDCGEGAGETPEETPLEKKYRKKCKGKKAKSKKCKKLRKKIEAGSVASYRGRVDETAPEPEAYGFYTGAIVLLCLLNGVLLLAAMAAFWIRRSAMLAGKDYRAPVCVREWPEP